jgi:mono/diheme cytochrome c family protein
VGSESKTARDDGPSHMPAVLAMMIVAVGVLSVPWLLLRADQRKAPVGQSLIPGLTEEEYVTGAKLYYRACAGCHEPRGEGRPGRYPPLVGASWLLDDKETPIRITLLGVSGAMEVGGQRYEGVMPNLGVTLSDEDIALVLSYVRGSFGNRAPVITKEEVAKVRASLGDRVAPWSGGEALIEARGTRVLP